MRAEIVRAVRPGRKRGCHCAALPPATAAGIPNQPSLTVVVLPPEQSMADQDATLALIERWTREYGSSARTFKSALVWAVPEGAGRLRDAAQKVLAWESIEDDQTDSAARARPSASS
ncbi:MAG: hypothetical protein V9H69_17645 [Anaerolineae bacterium]